MKTKFLFMAMLITLLPVLSSCNSKQASICKLERLTHELYLESYAYSPQQWSDASEKYDAISAELSEHEMDLTSQEKLYVKKLEAECYAFFGKNKATDLWNDVKEKLQME